MMFAHFKKFKLQCLFINLMHKSRVITCIDFLIYILSTESFFLNDFCKQ